MVRPRGNVNFITTWDGNANHQLARGCESKEGYTIPARLAGPSWSLGFREGGCCENFITSRTAHDLFRRDFDDRDPTTSLLNDAEFSARGEI
jgi:hypothetical protein